MSVYSLGAALEITSQRDPPPASQNIELSKFNYSNSRRPAYDIPITPADSEIQTIPTSAETSKTPKTPNELEMSRPPTPKARAAAEIMPSWNFPLMNKWRVLAACAVYFANGLNDAAPGALIPYMEKYYSVGYAIVSLIFVSNAIGFISMAFLVDSLLAKLGRAKSCMLSEAVIVSGYVIIACSPPFPAVVVAFFLTGLGMALNLALNNVFCANLANSTVILGAAHGSYGVGGVIAPIIATSLVSHGIIWSRFYIITLGLRALCFFFTGWAFKHYEAEATSILTSSLNRIASQQRTDELRAPTRMQQLKKALHNRTTIIGALFIFAYQGAEVSISGWVISYLIAYRGGDPTKVGYVTSGFWGGITLGRFVLSHLAPRIGEKKFVYILTAGSVAFQLLVWFIPNVIGDAVAVSVLGLLLGPVYPCGQTIFTQLLPMEIQMTAISFISSAGSSGGAAAPFLTGLLAQAVGTYVLHPICIGLFAVMVVCWFGLPKVVKRTD